MRRALALSLLLVPAVASAGFRVSSFKKETKLGANHWNVGSVIDNDPATCWMVDPENENAGEWFEVDLPAGTLDSVSSLVGWDDGDEHFKDHARLKRAKVEVFSEAGGESKLVVAHEVSFEDKRGWQTADVPDATVGDELHGGKVRVTVLEVFEGEDYPQLAVSEILFRLKEKDAPAMLSEAPATSADGHGGDAMVDGNAKTYWAGTGAGEQQFTLTAQGWGVSSLGIEAGPKTNARPKTVEVAVGTQRRTYTLDDKPGLQWVEVPSVVGYTGSAWGPITVKVTDSYPGTASQALAIAEVKVRATNYSP